MDFRPHKLQVVTFTGGGLDENGIPQQDTSSIEELPCRIVPNGSAQQIPFIDGTSHVYSFSIFLNQDCRTFSIGEKVKLFGLDGEVPNDKEFTVLGFIRNQLNARLWV
jgi:hypothetical protein